MYLFILNINGCKSLAIFYAYIHGNNNTITYIIVMTNYYVIIYNIC